MNPTPRSLSCSNPHLVLGIDVGSVSVSYAALAPDGALAHSGYRLHGGDVRGALLALLAALDWTKVRAVAATESAAPAVIADAVSPAIVAFVRAARRRYERLAALLVVGGEKFHLIRFDADGRYLEGRDSSPCAAGTGSFLDQQARRLGLADSAEVSRTALAAGDAAPPIASRCSVFAKTDLIHAQQEGHSVEAICNGLCRGLAANVIDTLFRGEPAPEGRIAFAGGVSRNEAVRGHLERMLGHELEVDPDSHLYGAIGAAALLLDELNNGRAPSALSAAPDASGDARTTLDPAVEPAPFGLSVAADARVGGRVEGPGGSEQAPLDSAAEPAPFGLSVAADARVGGRVEGRGGSEQAPLSSAPEPAPVGLSVAADARVGGGG
ncbi:MAG: BadF/BadG/BcrA/BcrD ATPase family protein, partial [Myxococcales bacterium]